MIIDQLPEISSVQTTDEMPVERGQTTYKTPISKICAAILASPTLTGTPKAPTADVSTDNTQIATTAFANRAANNAVSTFVRPNLLDNWYFVGGGSQLGYGTFPINQREQTTYSGTGYHIDRWANYNITRMDIVADGITIVSSANGFALVQNLANPTSYAGKTLTATALFSSVSGGTAGVRIAVNGAVYSGTDLTAGGLTTVTHKVTDSEASTISLNIRLSQGTTAKLVAVKLEIGDSQTLAHQESGVWVLNEIPDYAEQLAKCQAYFTKTSFVSEYPCSLGLEGSNPRITIPLPATMAKVPTFTKTGGEGFVFGVGSSAVFVGSSSSSIQISGGYSVALLPNAARVTFQTTDAVGGAYLPCAVEIPAFELSAE